MDIDVKGAKDALRQEMMTRRASISPEEATQAGLAICDQLAQLLLQFRLFDKTSSFV